jgi:branched-chain amino acid transport system ATP-binding protein
VAYARAVSPADVYWTQSGLVLIMVILGGVGTLIGPILGAAVELLLRNWVSSLPGIGERWMLIMGLIFGAFVLFARGGIVGVFARPLRGSEAGPPPGPAADVRQSGPPALSVLHAAPPALEVRGVGHSFGALRVLNNVSLTVAPGERHALIGPNGAGKTTLFNAVAGDLRAREGHVLLGSLDLTGLPAHARTQLGIGRTYQRTSHFLGLSALENVELALRRQRHVARDPFSDGAGAEPELRRAASARSGSRLGGRTARAATG